MKARCSEKTKVVSRQTAAIIRVHRMSAMDFSAAERARRIRLVLFDVDGVLTDGKIWTLPHRRPGGEDV